jgi:putative oxidoreductase
MAALFKKGYGGRRSFSSAGGGFMKNDDLGKLLIRLCVGGLMLFHGISKLVHGYGFIVAKLQAAGLPVFLVAGVPIGEVVAPLLIMLGLFTRPAALIEAFLMAMAVWLVHMGQLTSITAMGGYALELQAFYFFGALAVFFLGSGSYSFSGGSGRWN